MSGGFSLSNMFRPTQQVTVVPTQGQPQQQGVQGQPAQPQPTPGSTMQPNNSAAGNPNPAATNTGGDNSPLDAWKDVWHTDPKAIPPSDPWSQPILPSDPNKIREAAGKMDMMSGVPQDLLAKVTAGNDSQALIQLMNVVAQNTLAMSAQLSSASVERAGTVIRDRTNGSMKDQFRDFQLQSLPVENPVLNHPGAQGLLQMTRQQLKMKNPNWSAQQIQDEAVKYLTQFGSALTDSNAPKQSQLQPDGSPQQDWDNFLN